MSLVTNPSPLETYTAVGIAATGGFLVIPTQAATEPLRINGSSGDDLIYLNILPDDRFVNGIQDAASLAYFGLTPPETLTLLDAFNNVLIATNAVVTAVPEEVPASAARAIEALDTAIAAFQARGEDVSELVAARTDIANALGGQVDGLQGDDIIAAGHGYDCISGSEGSDWLFGNKGEDTIEGGDGEDSIFAGRDNDIVIGGRGQDVIFGDKGNDLLFGNEDADTVSGGEGNDTVLGGAGDDIVAGNTENDLVFGDLGNDSVYGGQGEDTVFGGAGEDVLFGDKGNDLMSGGEGEDTFRLEFFGGVPTPVSQSNRVLGLDTITDFAPLEDVIQLDLRLFPAIGDTLRASFGQITSSANLSSQEATIVYDPGQGLVYYNPTPAPGDEVDILKLDPAPTNLTNKNLSSF